jgi:hypothetical protein
MFVAFCILENNATKFYTENGLNNLAFNKIIINV